MMNTHTVQIGKLSIGNNNPVAVQTMTNTLTADVSGTLNQVISIAQSGADLVRITVPSMNDVEAVRQIKSQLRHLGIDIPLIADVHFQPEIAEKVASIVDKVRINPGNFVDKRKFQQVDMTDAEYNASLQRMCDRARNLFIEAKRYNTALRIGVNHGSLCDRIVSRYGNTPFAMAMSAMEWLDICNYYDYHNIVFSMKSSNVNTMMEATLNLRSMMEQTNQCYPLHLGVTEAGCGLEGRVKSAAGIGTLLLMGLGNTIRVSLTEKPENEIPFAKKLLLAVQDIPTVKYSISPDKVLIINHDEPDFDRYIAQVATLTSYCHFKQQIRDLQLLNNCFSSTVNQNLVSVVLQACRIKISKTEVISCPSCGRTQYNIESLVNKVKERFSDYPGLILGVMGCIVNGPGEMADAHFGIVGSSNGKVAVYKGKNRVSDFVSPDEAFSLLEQLIQG